MGQAEAQLGKPILLEEFGKRLVKGADAQLFADAIDHLRNPVFQTTMDLVASAIQACAPATKNLQKTLKSPWRKKKAEKEGRKTRKKKEERTPVLRPRQALVLA